MSNRYNKTPKIVNNSDMYKQILKTKNLKFIMQYGTFNFNNLKNLKDYELDTVLHKVQPFERLYMISNKYYQSPDYSWLICYTNFFSNETQIKPGDTLTIYLPLPSVLELL